MYVKRGYIMTGQRRKAGRHPANLLTATKVAKLKEPGRYFDGVGLYLRILETGTRTWVQKLSVAGKQTTLGHGGYPAVSLAEARKRALEAKTLARAGGNPVVRSVSSAPMLKAAIDAVVDLNRQTWRPGYETEFRGCLKHAEAIYGKRVDAITSADILSVLEPIWSEKATTAKRLKQRLGQILEWAIANGYRQDNPVTVASRALPKQVKKVVHMAAVPHEKAGDAVRKIQESDADPVIKAALEFVVLTAARSGEVRGMTWAEVDGDVWTVPAGRIKAGVEQRNPLSSRARAILEEMMFGEHSTGELVFPGRGGKEISRQALIAAFRDAGISETLHGCRSAFRDWCTETNVPDRVAEACLAHAVAGSTEAAYSRTDALCLRREVMERWADYVGAGL